MGVVKPNLSDTVSELIVTSLPTGTASGERDLQQEITLHLPGSSQELSPRDREQALRAHRRYQCAGAHCGGTR
jgi:hypothetical protein